MASFNIISSNPAARNLSSSNSSATSRNQINAPFLANTIHNSSRVETEERYEKGMYAKLSAASGAVLLLPAIKIILVAAGVISLVVHPLFIAFLVIGLILAIASLVVLAHRHQIMSQAGLETDSGKTFLTHGVGAGILGPLYLLFNIAAAICNSNMG